MGIDPTVLPRTIHQYESPPSPRIAPCPWLSHATFGPELPSNEKDLQNWGGEVDDCGTRIALGHSGWRFVDSDQFPLYLPFNLLLNRKFEDWFRNASNLQDFG